LEGVLVTWYWRISYIYTFWFNFDTALCQDLETGTSDRCLMGIVQLLRFLGFSLYLLSFSLYSPFKTAQKTDIKTSCWHCGLGYLDITKYKPSFIIFMFKTKTNLKNWVGSTKYRKIFSKNCEKILSQSILMWFEPTLTTNFFIFYHYHCFPCVLLMQRGLLIIKISFKKIIFIYYLLFLVFIVVFHKIPTTIVFKFQRIRFWQSILTKKN